MDTGIQSIPRFVDEAARRYGDRPFLVSSGVQRTFAEAAANAARGAGKLRACGVRPGDRVLLSATNGVPLIEAWLAAIHAGAIPAAVNPALTPSELDYVVSDLEPRIALGDADSLAALEAAAGARGVAVAAAGALADAEPAPVPDPDPADAAAIVYTSGTTSRPKGALVRHLAYVAAGQSMRTWIGLGERERLWCLLPFFHINAQAYSLMTALANGYRLTVSPKFRASTFWRDAAALDVTEVNLIGAMVAILEGQPPESYVPGPLRTIYAAPALEPERNRAFERRFDVRIVTGFGMSENTFGCVESPTSRAKRSSIGRPRVHPDGLVPNELRIVKTDGTPAARGEAGELQFRNAAVTPGYWNAPEVTARTLEDGWLHTGDAGYVDDDGDVVLVGRYKEMIRRRGENIAPREVEDALALHPDVREAAVIGVPSALSEEDVVACVIRVPGASADEDALRAWCRERLAPYKVPMRVLFRDEFPLTPTMRVAKAELKAQVLPILGEARR
ncbi:MAG TPA: AMP-binding protein [Candidatus Baltobacteraceae bacterium]|nr:AMP-binding protein [Candidatus Baltobacteraceae bacterium]